MLVYPARGRLEDLDTFDKNFGGRKQLVKIVNNFRYHKLGERLFNRVLRGDEDWLVYTDENNLDDYQNSIPFSEQELALIQQKIDNLRANLEARESVSTSLFHPTRRPFTRKGCRLRYPSWEANRGWGS